MKQTKRMIGILLSCLMLMSMLSVGVFAAAGTAEDPINANDKWFGYGVDCFLLNTTLDAGDTDGVWYELTADANGILQLEHSYNNVDYQITAWVNGTEYNAYEDGNYLRPIATYPVKKGDVVTIQIIAQDISLGGTVYLNAKIVTGENSSNQTIKVKSAPATAYIAAGSKVYFQDDSLQAAYAAQYVNVSGDSVEDVIFYTVSNSSDGRVVEKAFTDSDADGIIELKLGGAPAATGTPAVKPAWAIENNSDEDRCFVLTLADDAHECVYDDDADVDCNTCGEIREIVVACEHEYLYPCDKACMICYEVTNPDADHNIVAVEAVEATCADNGNIAYWYCSDCGFAWADEALTQQTNQFSVIIPASGEHTYDNAYDADCNVCNEIREVPTKIVTFSGNSVTEDDKTGLGLAFKFDVAVSGMAVQKGTVAVYDNASITLDGTTYKLKSMGAIACADAHESGAAYERTDSNVIDIPAVYLYNLDGENDIATFAVRIISIPDEHITTSVNARPYCIYEIEEGVEGCWYGDVQLANYAEVANS